MKLNRWMCLLLTALLLGAAAQSAPQSAGKTATKTEKSKTPAALLIDINSATAEQSEVLPGIATAYSAKKSSRAALTVLRTNWWTRRSSRGNLREDQRQNNRQAEMNAFIKHASVVPVSRALLEDFMQK